MKKRNSIGLSLLLGALTAGQSLSAAPKAPAKAAAKPNSTASFTLKSSIKDIGILRDGIMSEVPAGKAIAGRVGTNEVLFAAPGYGVRKIRFRLAAGEVKALQIDLAKSINPVDPVWKAPEKVLSPEIFRKELSICTWYQEKTNDGSVCSRANFLEDVAASEPGLFAMDDLKKLQSAAELKEYRRLLHQVYDTSNPELTQSIEDLYARRPDIRSVFQLAAMHNFVRGDCPRVHAIWSDAQQVFERPSEISIYKALCLELNSQQDASQALLQEEIKAQKSPPTYLYFHAGRQLLEKTPGKSWELANLCVRVNAFDLPCQELGAMAARLDNKFFKGKRFNLEDGTFKTLLTLESQLPKNKFEQAFLTVAPLLQAYPQSIEFYLFLSWIDSLAQIAPRSSFATQKMTVARLLGGGTLDKIIDALEKSDRPQLLIPVYRTKLRAQPSEPNLWFRLIRAHARAEECDQVLAVIQEGAQYLPKYSIPLLQIEASCHIQKNQFKPALEVYLKVLELNPAAWSTHYNLAAVYERLKMKEEMLKAYKQTLLSNPPADIKDNVQYRLLEIEGDSKSGSGSENQGKPKP